jgi:hypothetical protein
MVTALWTAALRLKSMFVLELFGISKYIYVLTVARQYSKTVRPQPKSDQSMPIHCNSQDYIIKHVVTMSLNGNDFICALPLDIFGLVVLNMCDDSIACLIAASSSTKSMIEASRLVYTSIAFRQLLLQSIIFRQLSRNCVVPISSFRFNIKNISQFLNSEAKRDVERGLCQILVASEVGAELMSNWNTPGVRIDVSFFARSAIYVILNIQILQRWPRAKVRNHDLLYDLE